jgi:hypothetical protein
MAPATVYRSPILGVCSEKTVRAIKDSQSPAVPSSDFAYALTTHVWSVFGKVHMLDFICDLACLIVLISTSMGLISRGVVSAAEKCFLTIFCCKSILEEVCEFVPRMIFPSFGKTISNAEKFCTICMKFFRYMIYLIYCLAAHLLDIRNAMDLVRLVVMAMGLSSVYTWQDETQQRSVVATWAFERWWHAMSMLRGFEMFGPRILPIVYAIRDTVGFIIVFLFVLGGAVHAFYVLGTRDSPTPLYAAFLTVYRLAVLGDFDMFELEGLDTPFIGNDNGEWWPEDPKRSELYLSVHTFFYVVTLAITIFTMNILIGILGSNYERFEEQSRPLFVRERARLIISLSSRPWVQCLWSKKEWREGRLWFAVRTTPNADEERSIAGKIQVKMDTLEKRQNAELVEVKGQNAELKGQITELKGQITELKRQNADLDTKMDAVLSMLKSALPKPTTEGEIDVRS